ARLAKLSSRIRTVPHFLVHILQIESAIAAPPGSGTHSILRVSLDHAIGDPQCIAALPVDSVATALQGNVQMLQPADGRRTRERSGRIDSRVASSGVATQNAICQARVQSIEQERFI